jgi:hypothetical protein
VPEAVNVLTAYVMPPDVYVVDVPPLTEAFGMLPPPPAAIYQVLAAVFSKVTDEYCATVVAEPVTVDAVPAVATVHVPAPALYKPTMEPVGKL